ASLIPRAVLHQVLLDNRHVVDPGDRLAPRMQVAALAERDQLLDDRTQVLRLRQRGGDLLVLDQRGAHVGEHGAAMLGRAVELAVGVTVTHRRGVLLYSVVVMPAKADIHVHAAWSETWMAGTSPAMTDSKSQ